jgi:hypothetical protein
VEAKAEAEVGVVVGVEVEVEVEVEAPPSTASAAGQLEPAGRSAGTPADPEAVMPSAGAGP